MEVIGQIICNICAQAGGVEPGHLRTIGQGSRGSKFVSREEAADIDLIDGSTNQTVIVIGRVEVEFLIKVVVEPKDTKVVVLRNTDVSFESPYIAQATSWNHVAAAEAAIALVWEWLIL